MNNQSVCLPVEWQDWEIIRTVGCGSYGKVYEIHRNICGYIEKAALKVISIPQSSNEIEELKNDGYDAESITAHFQDCLESIVKEYTLVREMKGYTNVVYCDDLKRIQHDDGIGWDIYIKMELLIPLTEYLAKDITDEQVIQLGLDICNALAHCKDKKIVHRDIKPQNIFVSEEGSFKLGDFGVAKIIEKTASGTKIGTYNYMAPEVYKGNPYGCNADIYSLGLVIYWLLNDRRLPFLPLSPQTIVPSMAEEARLRRFSGEALPKPLHGNEALKAIVLKACEYNPEERFSTPEDMINALSMLDPTDGMFSSKIEKERLKRERQKELERLREEARQREIERLKEEERLKEIERIKDDRERENKRQKEQEHQKKLLKKKLCFLISGSVVGLLLFVSVIMLLIKPETHVHTWENATCIAPKICSMCEETEGSPLGHTWMEATCTLPKICAVCGEVSGKAMDHQWKNATDDKTSLCSVCGAIDGTAKGNLMVSINDIVIFGNYEQDGRKTNGAEPIEWLVLEVQEDRALLLSRYALDSVPYNNTYESVTWENSTLRNWLNSTFLDAAFTEEEMNKILITKVDNSVTQCNKKWPFNGGNNTEDAVFLLSYADIDLYFDSPADCICVPTDYAIDMGADIRTLDDGSTAGWWWLRSPGEKSHHAAFVNFDGTRYTNAVGNDYLAVRPAMWIQLDGQSRSESLPIEIIRDRLPIVAFSLSSEEKIYGYEDSALTQKSESYYFKAATDEIVITDISDDGSALKVRYPSSLTESGYRSLWFSVNDIISLMGIETGEEEANTTITTYRYSQNNDTLVHYGTMEGGNKFVVLGTHESGCRAIIYSIYRKTKYGMDVHFKLALIK